ncbi:MAG TPA: cytidine deaminase [Ilumatobacter sp.]|nr:cytidine deaminase [Ilumatobacter sp.]
MPAYAVFEVVVDGDAAPDVAARYAEYKAAVPALIERHGGRYLARATDGEGLEGAPTSGRWHLVEFPSAEAARAFWTDADYLDLKPLREGAADVRAVLVDPGSLATDEALLAAAQTVQGNAHVPYSRFPVGAAIRTASGQLFTGCNYESAAYPQGVCAEGAAIAAMVTAGERDIDTIVTVCNIDTNPTPCGGCRQKIREFATPSTLIRVAGPSGFLKTYTMDELLPDSFGPENLLST